VFPGASGQFTLYQDAGEGLGYQQGQYAQTPIRYDQGGAAGATSTVTIGAQAGHYPGQLASRSYQIHLADISTPRQVMINHQPLAQVSPGSSAPGWWYDAANAALRVNTPQVPTGQAVTVSQAGGRPVTRSESAAVSLTLDPATPMTLDAGQSAPVTATVDNAGPGAITGLQVSLPAPPGWTVTPTGATSAASVPAGGSATTPGGTSNTAPVLSTG
jgi:Domain of unknown function (DUF5110)/NPCBM-associated, NEW3 domain of alpha-galactosidase